VLILHQIRYTTPIYRKNSRERLGERLGSGDARDPDPATLWLVVSVISSYFEVEADMWGAWRHTHNERELLDSEDQPYELQGGREGHPDEPANSVVTKAKSRQI
jgi:hypothetical protein